MGRGACKRQGISLDARDHIVVFDALARENLIHMVQGHCPCTTRHAQNRAILVAEEGLEAVGNLGGSLNVARHGLAAFQFREG